MVEGHAHPALETSMNFKGGLVRADWSGALLRGTPAPRKLHMNALRMALLEPTPILSTEASNIEPC